MSVMRWAVWACVALCDVCMCSVCSHMIWRALNLMWYLRYGVMYMRNLMRCDVYPWCVCVCVILTNAVLNFQSNVLIPTVQYLQTINTHVPESKEWSFFMVLNIRSLQTGSQPLFEVKRTKRRNKITCGNRAMFSHAKIMRFMLY